MAEADQECILDFSVQYNGMGDSNYKIIVAFPLFKAAF